MKEEVVDNLVTNKSGIYLDCTLGFGGHAKRVLKELGNKGIIVGLDCDPDAYKYSLNFFKSESKDRIKIFNANYIDYESILNNLSIKEVDGAFMDLGISSYQVDSEGRGFSYRYDAPLDMRFDINYKKTAYHILNTSTENNLAFIIKSYGEEKNYKNIAKSIVKYSKKNKMKTTYDLKDSIKEVTYYKNNINKVFSRVFQAVRIEVNNEFENIKKMIADLPQRVKIGGRIVFITFHSLEDRIVKRATFALNNKKIDTIYGRKKVMLLSKKIIKPSRSEILTNRRSRSAKLRVLKIVA